MSTVLTAASSATFSPAVTSGAISALTKSIVIGKRTDDGLAPLHQLGTKVRLPRNTTIFNEGDDADSCYKIVSGAVRLCKHTANGRRQIADFLLAGDHFGFLQLEAYNFTAEAVSDVVLIAYPHRQVEHLADTLPGMGRRLLMLLSQRVSGMQDHLVMLGRQAAKERVASFLLKLAQRSDADEGEAFDIPMGRQDMADYLGLTIETVCRALSELKRSKLIGIPNVHQIVIANTEGLQDAADNAD